MGIAEENYDFFVNKEGATEIATREALRIIENLIIKENPSYIVEIGSGIGTITRLLLMKSPSAKLICLEKSLWCVDRFKENLQSSTAIIFNSLQDLIESIEVPVDLIIVDDYLDLEETEELLKKSRPRIIFIEGYRRMQQLYFFKAIKDQSRKFKYTHYPSTKDSYKGGVKFEILDFPINKFSDRRYANCVHLVIIGKLQISKIIELRSKIEFRKIFRIN
jgi:hypothetical protein